MGGFSVSTNFEGGNAVIKKIEGNTIYLDSDLRDTTEDWFYWAVCVMGAAGQTITFDFDGKNRIGYYGPAVSGDLENWSWMRGNFTNSEFTYTFKENENKVYFAHDMVYSRNMFYKFAQKDNLKTEVLCVSKKGRNVPFVRFGEGKNKIVLTARHHSCESTGSYVLEGVLEYLHENAFEDVSVFCVPFVDFDGVVDGDQGKSRFPHDHNRDYDKSEGAIYSSVGKIREYIDQNDVALAFDFHSPWHMYGGNDKVFIVRKDAGRIDKYERFGNLLMKNLTASSLKYDKKDDIAPGQDWNNSESPCFANYALKNGTCDIAFTLETCYFGEEDNVFTKEKAAELGRCFGKTICEYLKIY